MWLLVPITFIVVTAGSFLLLRLFVRAGRNRGDEVATPRGSRPLIFGALTHALAGMVPIRPETRDHSSTPPLYFPAFMIRSTKPPGLQGPARSWPARTAGTDQSIMF